MKTTDALMIRSRDIVCGGRAVVVDGLLTVLPRPPEPADRGQRPSFDQDTTFCTTVVSRGSANTIVLRPTAQARPGAFGK